MESRSWYEQQQGLDRIMRESRADATPRGTIAEGFIGSRGERRAQAKAQRKAMLKRPDKVRA